MDKASGGFISDPTLADWIKGFLLARKAEGRRAATLTFYTYSLRPFEQFASGRRIEQIDAGQVRAYILAQQAQGLSAGTIRARFRALKAFFRWYQEEAATDGWVLPTARVRLPSADTEPLDPASPEIVRALLAHAGARDKALLFVLADVGLRAGEVIALDLADFDQTTGALFVRRSKNGKPRQVFLGRKAARAVRAWVHERGTQPGALFPSQRSARMTYDALRMMVLHVAARAGVEPPKLHSFRRACALGMVRAGADLLTVSRVLGHSSLAQLMRYVKLDSSDLADASTKYSQGDKL